MTRSSYTSSLRIGFIHPDLGLGGAERLVVDAALHLQAAGHRITMFTAHHDRGRCFEETRDGTLEVRVYGDFLPIHVGQHLRAPCAMARMAYLACAMALRGGRFDVIFCDLVPHIMPLLRLVSRARIVFYCHFPDQLLTPHRSGLYRCYRAPIDWLEAVGTGMADLVLVNSQFTAAMFHRTFPRLRAVTPVVLYPGVDMGPYEHLGTIPDIGNDCLEAGVRDLMILSLNRYERQKNIGLAIEAFALLRTKVPAETFQRTQLMIAGGYDSRLREHQVMLQDLRERAQRLRLSEQVVFLLSCTEAERLALLSRCLCVVYTPENEHFGLVPVEAMAAGRPVIAVNSGGPLETVRHGETGFLCGPTPEAFADALAQLLTNRKAAARMGQAGREHVATHFSRTTFGSRLEAMLASVMTREPQP
jgi:alpha-1,3/alpha-1,6-mannosyltransferase